MEKRQSVTNKKKSKQAHKTTPKQQEKECDSSSLSPLSKRIKRMKIKQQVNTLPTVWLSKADLKPTKSNDNTKTSGSKQTKAVSGRSGSKLMKTSKSKTLKRSDSSDNELPSFDKKNKNHRKTKNESFERYGILFPSVNDILEEQKDFDEYKKLVDEASSLQDLSFKLPFCVEELSKPIEKNVEHLDCKHLTLEQLNKEFEKNFNFISGILNGKTRSDRHNRFYNYDKNFEHTTRDLTYNTSMIVFSFEQTEHLLSLLKEKLDPEDKLIEYFFKVLLPELCLRIFMDTHGMSKRKAMEYLDSRPVET